MIRLLFTKKITFALLFTIVVGTAVPIIVYYSIKDIDLNEGEGTTPSSFNIDIEGDTGRVSHPEILTDNENNIYVIWENNSGNLYDSSQIYLQKFDSNGNNINEKLLLVESLGLSNSKIALDSDNNLHLFWFDLRNGTKSPGNSEQYGQIYYKKYDNYLQLTIAEKPVKQEILTILSESGTGAVSLRELIVDEKDNLHLMTIFGYCLLDSNGTIILEDHFSDDYSKKKCGSITIDNQDNVFIVWESYDDIIHFRKISIAGNAITVIVNYSYIDEREYVSNPKILLRENELYLYFYYYSDIETCCQMYKLNNNGEVLSNSSLPYGSLVFSSNKSYIHHFVKKGVHFEPEKNIRLFYSKYNIYSDLLINSTEILTIQGNLSYFWGPCLFGFVGTIDTNEHIVLSWFINDGTNNYQIYLWKLDKNGDALIPVRSIAP